MSDDTYPEEILQEELLYKDETYAILGACFAVYKDKGCGFLEAVYQECLEIEFDVRAIPFERQPRIKLTYRGRTLEQTYMPDFVCYDRIIVELKSLTRLMPEHRAQTMNYLRATQTDIALLVNFGHYPRLEYERIVATTGRYAKNRVEEETAEYADEIQQCRE